MDYQIEFEAISLPGSREENEDSFKVIQHSNQDICAVVADGLGGHGFGEVASQTTVQSFESVFSDNCTMNCEDFLKTAFDCSQKEVLQIQVQKNNKMGMKTTCVALTVSAGKVQWGHIGDSRLYAFKNNRIRVRTLDHSVPQMLVVAREIKEKKIRNHPDRNKLLRVIGIPWDGEPYEISDEYEISDFDAFLLCSDGFWELIEERKMQKLLKKSATPKEWLDMMSEIVVKNGQNLEMDNYTAVAVWIKS